MIDKPTPTDAATPECLTCSDHGAVGNILTAEPCPDCTRLNAQPAPAAQQAADLLAMVSKALREAYNLGMMYWQQADSEYISQHKKADDTRAKFMALVEETCAALAAWQATAPRGAAYAALPEKYYLAGGEVPTWDAKQMRAFADATNTLRASHGQAPAATTFCWATELAMAREPVTLTVKEAREVSDQMQRLHAASFKTELRNLTSIDLDGDQAVRLAFMSCREASAFKRAVEAHG